MTWKLICKYNNEKTTVQIFNIKKWAQKEIDSRRGLMYTVNAPPDTYSIERVTR
jgi:hypothetical protein